MTTSEEENVNNETANTTKPTMEEQLLLDMITDRDDQINDIKDKIKRQDDKIARTLETLTNFRIHVRESNISYKKEVLDIINYYNKVHEQLKIKEKQTKHPSGTSTSMHVYAEMLKEVSSKTGNVSDSSYVLRMQSQLCKAMHMMGCIDHQMVICKEHNSILIKLLKDTMTSIVDGKSSREVEIMNELIIIDTDKKTLEDIYTRMINKIYEKINTYQKQLSSEDSDDDSDSDDDENDDSDEESSSSSESEEENDESSMNDSRIENNDTTAVKTTANNDNSNENQEDIVPQNNDKENGTTSSTTTTNITTDDSKDDYDVDTYKDEIEERFNKTKKSILSDEEIATRERVKALLEKAG